MKTSHRPLPRPGVHSAQHGVVLLFALISLVIMLIAGVALVRSFDTSLFQAGNIGFKRDLLNQGERAVPIVLTAMRTGALSTPAARANHAPAQNYSASILESNPSGIPLALLDNAVFAARATAADIAVADQGVTVRYIIDRLCATTGLDTALTADTCTTVDNGLPAGGSASELQNAAYASGAASAPAAAVPQQVVYRLSIRADGPRNTQAFFQTTFTTD
jgi:type IV pilus assembly protein PilX